MPSDRPDPSDFLAQAQRMLRELFGDAQRRRGALGGGDALRARVPRAQRRSEQRENLTFALATRAVEALEDLALNVAAIRQRLERTAPAPTTPRTGTTRPGSDRASLRRCSSVSAAIVVSSPCPVRTTVSPGSVSRCLADRRDDRRVIAVPAARRARTPAEQRVAGEHRVEVRGERHVPPASDPRVDRDQVDPADRECRAVGEILIGRGTRLDDVPEHLVGGVEQIRVPAASAGRTAAATWSLCPWASTIAMTGGLADRFDDRGGVGGASMTSTSASSPTIQTSSSTSNSSPSSLKTPLTTTWSRRGAISTPPSSEGPRRGASSRRHPRPRREIVLLTNASRSKRPCRYRSMSIGKSRLGRQSPYQEDLAPRRGRRSRSAAARSSCRGRDADQHDGAGGSRA